MTAGLLWYVLKSFVTRLVGTLEGSEADQARRKWYIRKLLATTAKSPDTIYFATVTVIYSVLPVRRCYFWQERVRYCGYYEDFN